MGELKNACPFLYAKEVNVMELNTHKFETSLYAVLLTIRKTPYMVAMSAKSTTDMMRILQIINYEKIADFINPNIEVDVLDVWRLSDPDDAAKMFKKSFYDNISVDFVINQVSGYPIMERIKKSDISPNVITGATETNIWHIFDPTQRKKYYRRAHDISKQVELALRFHCVTDMFVRRNYTFTKEHSLMLPFKSVDNPNHDNPLPGSATFFDGKKSTRNAFVLYTSDFNSLTNQIRDIYTAIPPKTDVKCHVFQFYYASLENHLIYRLCVDDALTFVPIQQVII